jgi:hypothetical protein
MALDALTRSEFLWLGLVLIVATLIATIVVFRRRRNFERGPQKGDGPVPGHVRRGTSRDPQ